MKFTNVSLFEAGWTVGFDSEGREQLVVMVKGTYDLPIGPEPAEPSGEQKPLVQADEFEGEPGTSAPRLETDYAQHKPACDVVLLGSAHAPAGTAVRHTEVRLKVGSMDKKFAVTGDRFWSKGAAGLRVSDPNPFVKMPVGYHRAFGGTDRTKESEGKIATYVSNPAGRGFWRYSDEIEGKPLPNTEEIGRPVNERQGNYIPMALSQIGRAWEPRWRFAGTYDASWLENEAPLWPRDFDYRYFQTVSADQIIPYPVGAEEVVLENLTPDGFRSFTLPQKPMPITFIPHQGRDVIREARLDTIVIEPDENRFTTTWRCGLSLGKSIFDVKETIAGEVSRAWQRARRFPNKVYYENLADAVSAKKKGKG